MYWTLTGYLAGFVAAFLAHGRLTGALDVDRVVLVPFLAVFILFIAAELECGVPSRWKQAIRSRRASRVLTRRFCVLVGVVAGAMVYPCVPVFGGLLGDDSAWQTSWTKSLLIVLILLVMGVSIATSWYVLTRYPRDKPTA